MVPTFIGVTIYAAVAITVGLLVLRYSRWRPQPLPQSDINVATNPDPPGWGCGIALTLLVLIAVGVLGGFWLFMAR
jgi:hypothetical protein